jgi:hypothetical protein
LNNSSGNYGTYRDPQWQKSDDTEKKFLGSSTYLASKRPYIASLSGLRAPTRMGTIFTGHLQTSKGENVTSRAFTKLI